MEISVEEAVKDFKKILDHVVQENDPVIITGPDGQLVRISPVPKPLYFYKGHPVYRRRFAIPWHSAVRVI